MTDITDIAALRSKAANIIGLLTAESLTGSFALDSLADVFDDMFRLLEAERQRADNANDGWLKVIAERDAAEQKSRNYEQVAHGLAEELAALKYKLANPVVLSDCSFEAVSHMAHWYSEGECVAWVSGAEHVKKQILEAGFTVKEQ